MILVWKFLKVHLLSHPQSVRLWLPPVSLHRKVLIQCQISTTHIALGA